MVCLGLEPGAAGWNAQTNPLSYGSIPTLRCGTLCRLEISLLVSVFFDSLIINVLLSSICMCKNIAFNTCSGKPMSSINLSVALVRLR